MLLALQAIVGKKERFRDPWWSGRTQLVAGRKVTVPQSLTCRDVTDGVCPASAKCCMNRRIADWSCSTLRLNGLFDDIPLVSDIDGAPFPSLPIGPCTGSCNSAAHICVKRWGTIQ
jgi:hypothetical protein